MKKQNTEKFPGTKDKMAAGKVKIFDSTEEAAAESKREAEAAGVMPTAIMNSAPAGYATGDGEIHEAKGVVKGNPPVTHAYSVPPAGPSTPVVEEKPAKKAKSDDE